MDDGGTEETMARSRADDRLDRAMDVFWEKGYYDTSIDELMSRTGLHRAAVYGEFGSKRRLFEAALRRYREKVITTLVAPLSRPDAALADVDRFFRRIHRAAAAPKKRRGCLMVNTASEVSPHIRSVARIVSTYLGDLRALLRRACENARTRGEVRSDTDVDRVADYLVGLVLGLWTLARSPASATSLRHYVDGVRGFLESLQPEAGRARPSGSRSGQA
jgi:TetR/AcrR family transcriptional regulator, transcriptional repressor for nem operon